MVKFTLETFQLVFVQGVLLMLSFIITFNVWLWHTKSRWIMNEGWGTAVCSLVCLKALSECVTNR